VTTPEESGRFWLASQSASNPVHCDFLRFVLLTGQRRTETSRMEWAHVSGDRWHLPAENTKTGADHTVPLGPLSLAIIEAQPRHAGTSFVLPGRGLKAMSGWSKLIAPVRRAYGDDRLTIHGLRRAFRTGLSALGVDEPVAELMIAHKRSDIVGRYDHADLWDRRIDAQHKWEEYIEGIVG